MVAVAAHGPDKNGSEIQRHPSHWNYLVFCGVGEMVPGQQPATSICLRLSV